MLSPTEVRNAIYLDFEGEGKKRDGSVPKPHMAGTFRPNQTGRGGKHHTVFFRPQWNPASTGTPNSECRQFQHYFQVLLYELRERNCHLVYWTIHESMILAKYLKPEIYQRLTPYLFNLHPMAKKYVNHRRQFRIRSTARGWTLDEFVEALSISHTYPLFPLGAAEACRRIDTATTQQNQWELLSDRQKRYVNDLVQYNNKDCFCTWLIAKRLGNAYNKATGVALD